MTGDGEKPADELTPAEALEVFDAYERAVLTDLEVKVDGAPATMRRALDRALGDDQARPPDVV